MPRQFTSKESVKLIWMQAESKVMQGCFYCGKCESCNNFLEIENECKAKVLLNFNKDMKDWELAYRGKNKHFKITPQETDFSFFVSVSQITSRQMLEKANMLFLTKEATDKDRSLETQLLTATD